MFIRFVVPLRHLTADGDMIASELKIYRDTYDLVMNIIDIQTRFPRVYKFTIGQKMVNTALELFEYIQLANMSRESRAKYLNGFIIKFELLKTIVRMSADKRIIDLKQQANIARKTNSIGKQVSAWKNASTNH